MGIKTGCLSGTKKALFLVSLFNVPAWIDLFLLFQLHQNSTSGLMLTSTLYANAWVLCCATMLCYSLLVSLDDFEGKDVTLHPKRKLRCESPQFPFKENPIIST